MNKNNLIFVLRTISVSTKKRTKETYGSPLFTIVAHGPSRARTKKCKVLFTPALLERERERERVYKYLELPNIQQSFFRFSPRAFASHI